MLDWTPTTNVDVVPGDSDNVSRLPEIDCDPPIVRAAMRARGSPLPPVSACTSPLSTRPSFDADEEPPEPFCNVMPMLCVPPPVNLNQGTTRFEVPSIQLVVFSV